MKKTTIILKNESGLHARPAALVINKAKEYGCSFKVKKGEKEINLKSLISLLALGISRGEEIILSAEGEGEETALEEMTAFIEGLSD